MTYPAIIDYKEKLEARGWLSGLKEMRASIGADQGRMEMVDR